ncbi:hypothetical protein B0H12DRAFT_1245072 [Mycena haematopus]|nr:hypothetical protein B0H12DRAFT_1245072 [Mycena haematopus]
MTHDWLIVFISLPLQKSGLGRIDGRSARAEAKPASGRNPSRPPPESGGSGTPHLTGSVLVRNGSPTWYSAVADVQAVTNGVPFALHQGYSTRAAAEAAFELAQANNWTCVLASWFPVLISGSLAPKPVGHESGRDERLCERERDAPWYVVYRGVNPGVFATHVECQLNVLGISGAVYESIPTYAEARHERSEVPTFFSRPSSSMPARALTNDELETRQILQSIYSARYYRKHRDERNAQTRQRMARLRAQESQLPQAELEARLAARREAAHKYREKNQRALAIKARQRRAHAKAVAELLIIAGKTAVCPLQATTSDMSIPRVITNLLDCSELRVLGSQQHHEGAYPPDVRCRVLWYPGPNTPSNGYNPPGRVVRPCAETMSVSPAPPQSSRRLEELPIVLDAAGRRLVIHGGPRSSIRQTPERIRTPRSGPIRQTQRAPRSALLTAEMLWVTDDRPPPQAAHHPDHECGICKSVKSHPVSFSCTHSFCYVCIHLHLERRLRCPTCKRRVYSPPFRNLEEDRTLAAAYPGRDDRSAVIYCWEDLIFPERRSRH